MDKIRWNIPKAMSCVFDALKKSKLRVKKTKTYSTAINRFCKLYGISQTQVWILCMVCDHYVAQNDSFIMNNFSDVLEVSAMSIMSWKKEVEILIEKGFLEWNKRNYDFQPSSDFMNTLCENTDFETKEKTQMDDIEFLSTVGRSFCDRRRDDRSARSVHREMGQYEKACENLDVVKRACGELENVEDRMFLYDIAYDVIRCSESSLNITYRRSLRWFRPLFRRRPNVGRKRHSF